MIKFYTIFCSILFFALFPQAQAREPFPQFEAHKDIQTFAGNWKVTLTNPNTNEIITKFMTMEPQFTKYCDPPELDDCIYNYRYLRGEDWRTQTENMTNDFVQWFHFSGNQMFIQHSYHTMGRWGAESGISFSGNSGVGVWAYKKDTGPEKWQRAISKIDKVDFFTVGAGDSDPAVMTVDADNYGRITGVYEPAIWGPRNTISGNRPSFFIDIYGDNLWGFHLFDVEDGPEFDPRPCRQIKGETKKSNLGVIGLRCWVNIAPNVTNGRKTLRLDHHRIKFDLVVEGLPDEPQKESLRVKINDLIVDAAPHEDAIRSSQEKTARLKAALEDKQSAVEYRKKKFDDRLKIYRENVKKLDEKIAPMRKAFAGLTPSESPEYQKAKSEHWNAQQDYNRLFKIEKGRMNDAVDAYDAAEKDVDKSYNLYARSHDHLLDLKKNAERELVQVSITPAFLAKIHDRSGAMLQLEAAIKEAEDALYWADVAREKARLEMLFANDMLTITSDELVSGIYASALSQRSVDAAIQIKDAIDNAKGGPGALILWTSLRLTENVLNPPKIYEPDYGNNEKRVAIFEDVLEGYHLTDGKMLKTGAKYGATTFWKGAVDLKKNSITRKYFQKEMNRLIAQELKMPLDSPTIPGLKKMFAEQQALFDKADTALRDKSFRSGKGKFTSAWGMKLLKGQVTSITSESLKRGLAEFFEGDNWRAYVDAEQEFAYTVRVFRMNGNIYWKNRDIVTGLKGLKAALESKQFDDDTGFQFERNELFDLKIGKEISLYFTGDIVEGSDGVDFQYYDAPIKVSLDGVSLVRVKNSNRFRLTAAGYDLLEAKHNEALKLEVLFE